MLVVLLIALMVGSGNGGGSRNSGGSGNSGGGGNSGGSVGGQGDGTGPDSWDAV